MGHAAPRAAAAPEEPQHTLEWEPGEPLYCLGSPPGTHPSWGSGTLHCTGSLHTGWGACTPTYLQPVGPPTYLPHWGLTLYPASWEDHRLSQGTAPRGSAGRRGEGEGPAAAVTSTSDQVLLLWPLPQGLVPGPPLPQGSSGAGVLWVPFCCPGQVWGLGLGIQ